MRSGNSTAIQRLNYAGRFAFGNPWAFGLAVFFFLMGISTGVFLELNMTPAEKNNLAASLTQYLFSDNAPTVFPSPFFSSATNNLFLLLLIFLGGLSILGFPVALLTLAYKGMALGFCAELVLESLGAKGVWALLTSLVPQNLILIPVFVAAAAGAGHYAFLALSLRRGNPLQKKSGRESSKVYLFLMICLAGLILIACGVEAMLYQAALSP